MPGEKPKLTPLAARKQLLLLESDLNRAQFIEALHDWKDAFHRSKEHLTRFGTIASTAARLTTTFSTARRLFSRNSNPGGKKSWFSMVFDGVSTGASLWYLLRSRQRNKHEP